MRKEKILALTTFAILLASCSNDDEIPRFENLEGTPIVIKAGVNNMITRAGWDNNNLPDRFIVSIDQDGTEYDYENVKMYRKSDNSYAPQEGTTLIWGSNAHQATIKAYYLGPTQRTLEEGKEYSMLGEYDAEYIRQYDYLGASSAVEGDIQISGSAVNINFRHLACKLDVNYTWSNELKSIDDKKITWNTHEGFGYKVTINFENGTVEKYDDSVSQSYDRAYLYSNADGTYTSEFLFAPYCSSPKITIEATIEGEKRKFEVNVPEPAGGFKSGHRYTLNVCVGGNSAQAGTVNIAQGWDTNTSDGSFEME